MALFRLHYHDYEYGFFYGVNKLITQEYLKECVDYDRNTGIFTWKYRPLHHFASERYYKRYNKNTAGKKLLSKNKDGYISTGINNQHYKAHHLAWLYVYGEWPCKNIDHINGIRYDNRIENLRLANNAENKQNLKKCQSNNKTSGLLGVSFIQREQKYKAAITIQGKKKHIGYFHDKYEAHEAYLTAKRELHPFGEL